MQTSLQLGVVEESWDGSQPAGARTSNPRFACLEVKGWDFGPFSKKKISQRAVHVCTIDFSYVAMEKITIIGRETIRFAIIEHQTPTSYAS